jgi:hypothetical protein
MQEEFESQEIADEPISRPKRSPLIWVGAAVIGLVVLAGAAFIGGRLMQSKPGAQGGLLGPGGEQVVSIAINVTPAPELPVRTADVTGMYSRRDGNSIFVNQISDGPEIEIVVTGKTQIFRDATTPPEVGPGEMPDTTIQQVVEEVSNADAIGKDFIVVVWGARTGDRIVAETLLYAEPLMIGRSAEPAP